MHRKIEELNRVVRAISILTGSSPPDRERVIAYCREQVIAGLFPNHDETIHLCAMLGLVSSSDLHLFLTDIGKKFFDLRNSDEYELSDKQRKFLIEVCFLTGSFAEETKQIVLQLVPSYSENTFVWNKIDNVPIACDQNVLDMLVQLGMVTEDENGFYLEKMYVNEARMMRKLSLPKTSEELAKDLEIDDKIGKIAELIVLEYERNRLREIGCELEAKLVQRVSELDVESGFDIISFDRQSADLVPNRYIEVKGSREKNVRFYLTRNEIEKSRVLGQRYWIYFIGGIKESNESHYNAPILMQDPFSSILKNENYDTQCEVMLVFKN